MGEWNSAYIVDLAMRLFAIGIRGQLHIYFIIARIDKKYPKTIFHFKKCVQ